MFPFQLHELLHNWENLFRFEQLKYHGFIDRSFISYSVLSTRVYANNELLLSIVLPFQVRSTKFVQQYYFLYVYLLTVHRSNSQSDIEISSLISA